MSLGRRRELTGIRSMAPTLFFYAENDMTREWFSYEDVRDLAAERAKATGRTVSLWKNTLRNEYTFVFFGSHSEGYLWADTGCHRCCLVEATGKVVWV